MQRSFTPDDIRWLVGPEGARLVARLATASGSLVGLVERFRREFPAERVRLALELGELRCRGRAKFPRADEMFFLPQPLEQATDAAVASYKALRFPENVPLGDLCCGIGGDLLALARRGPVTAVDRDEAALVMAEANVRALLPAGGGPWRFLAARVEEVSAEDLAAWHLDPDRRAAGRRTTRLAAYAPGPRQVERLLEQCPDGAVKLAPATELPEDWEERAEREWIGRERQCRQQVAWFGRLAEFPGRRRATVLAAGAGDEVRASSVVGDGTRKAPRADEFGRWLFEPDPAVLAAGLAGELARTHALAAPEPALPYLTGDRPVDDPALQCFELIDRLPFDRKRVRALLRRHGVGRLEIKARGVDRTPDRIRQELRPEGAGAATLVVARLRGRMWALLARRPG